MTEISDQELIHKMLQSLAALRTKFFGDAGPQFGPKMRKYGFGKGGLSPADLKRGPMFRHDGFSPMGGAQPMSAGPAGNWGADLHMMGHRPGMGSLNGFAGRQGRVRESLLTIIAAAPEGIRAKDVAKRAGINQSSTSESLSKLEDDGYIKRTVDPADKRATLIFLTDLGKARANEIKDQQEAVFGHLFDNLTADEKTELARLLDKIIDGE